MFALARRWGHVRRWGQEMESNLWLIRIMRESGVLPGRSRGSSVESTNQRRAPISFRAPSFVRRGRGGRAKKDNVSSVFVPCASVNLRSDILAGNPPAAIALWTTIRPIYDGHPARGTVCLARYGVSCALCPRQVLTPPSASPQPLGDARVNGLLLKGVF